MISKLFKEGDMGENAAMLFAVGFISTALASMFGGMVALQSMTAGITTGLITFITLFIVTSWALSTEKEFNLKIYLSLFGIAAIVIPILIFFFWHLTSIIPTWGSALIVLILFIFLTEILFWLDSSKPKNKKDVMFFTFKRKAEAATEAGLLTVLAGTTGYVLKEYNIWEKIKQFLLEVWEVLKEAIPKLLKVIGMSLLVIGALVLVVYLVYLYIRLNSMKYKNSFKKKKKRSKK